MQLLKKSWKTVFILLVALFIGTVLTGCSSEKEMDALEKENKTLKKSNQELQAKVEEAEPWFKLTEEEKKQKEAEVKAKKEAEEKAKAEQEEKERKAKEEKEKQGYNTGITYEQLARTPDDYIGEKIKFSGEIVQVIEEGQETQIRLAVNGDYDAIIFAIYESSIVKSRILEDDTITFYGVSTGLITYESTLGGNISIPGAVIDKIEQ